MSVLKPFRAYRPTQEKATALACRPYDVLSAAEARAEAEGNADSFYRVVKPEIDFPADHDPYHEAIYQRGKDNFDQLVQAGTLVQDEGEYLYIYQLIMDGHAQTG
ncbi:MAG: DUF1015 family protein, partial [Bacteroidota bacterium]